MTMQTKIVWNEVIADGSTESHYFDFAQIFSSFNRKQMHQIDGKGNAQTYLLKITQATYTGADQGDVRTSLFTAPNTYVTKQAVKAWHQSRIAMYRKAGISMKSLSPYTRNLRVLLDASAPSPSGTTDTELRSGQPELSTMVNAAQFDESNTGALTGDDMVDKYTFTLLGDHALDQTVETTKYTTVGVNKSWLDARRQPYAVADSASAEAGVTSTLITAPQNPLLESRALSGIAEEIIGVAKDEQVQEPPWSNDTQEALIEVAAMYTANNSTQEVIVEVPLGLMKATIEDLRSTNNPNLIWNIELLDVYDM